MLPPLNTSLLDAVRDAAFALGNKRKFWRIIKWSCYLFFALPAQTEAPFYEEWWFLLVMALSSLILILLVVFALVLHGQSKKYKNCSTGKMSAPLHTHTNVQELWTLEKRLPFNPWFHQHGHSSRVFCLAEDLDLFAVWFGRIGLSP